MRWTATATAEEFRDPFVFGSRPDSLMGTAGPIVVGVLWDAVTPLAMIGEKPVKVGDLVLEWEIIEIKSDGIMIQRGDRRTFVEIGAAVPRD
jgi:hypothetical protein